MAVLCSYYYYYYYYLLLYESTYIPETNYVPREYGVAAILLLLFMALISLVSVLNLLYFYLLLLVLLHYFPPHLTGAGTTANVLVFRDLRCFGLLRSM